MKYTHVVIWLMMSLSIAWSDENTRTYPAKGVVEKIAPDKKVITVHHEDIPGYMMSMTMDFKIEDPGELKGIEVGDTVSFNLVVGTSSEHIEDLKVTGKSGSTISSGAMTMPDTDATLKPGDPLPDPALVAEDGRTVHLSDFRGQVVALTFFFTRCPLPDYCPLMNKNFAATRQLLSGDPKAPKNWQFISVSFDANFDQPATLTSYAAAYRNKNPDRWLFVAAPPAALSLLAPRVGLMIMGQDGNLSHNLRTLVLDPQGRLSAQFNDNQCTPRQLADAMKAAAQGGR